MQPNRRKADREKAGVTAACRVRGIAYRAMLSEVSQLGCCVEMAAEVTLPGERVVLQLGRLLVLPAIVRWVKDGKAGLEFANPLHGAMVRQFALHQDESRRRLH